jgi:hypothetical protein
MSTSDVLLTPYVPKGITGYDDDDDDVCPQSITFHKYFQKNAEYFNTRCKIFLILGKDYH